jgi:8-oxo-dGTP diphosphatase
MTVFGREMNHFEPKAIEVVAGLIVEHGRVLICQRSAASEFPLKWEFPGGKVEIGENPPEALRRELREELAIEIQEWKEIFRHVHHYRDMPPVALRFYQVARYQGEIKNLIFQQIAWAPVPNLAQFDFLEGDLPLIKKLMSPNAGGLGL